MSPQKWWWTPATTYIVIAGVLRLIWPAAFEFIGGMIAIAFIYLCWVENPVYAIRTMGYVIFPIRNTKVIETGNDRSQRGATQAKQRSVWDEGTIIDPNDDNGEPLLTPEEMHRLSTKKQRWERGLPLEELENRGELPF